MTWMICLFGGIGAMARYVLDVSIQRSWNRDGNHSFPLATLVINGVAPCAPASHDVVLCAVGGYGHGNDVRCGVPRRILNILVGDQRGAVADSQTPFRHGPGYGAATVAVPLACVALGFGIAMLGGHA